MGKLSLDELTSTKLSSSIVDTISAIQGGTEEYCHNGYGKPNPPVVREFECDNLSSGHTSG